MHVHENVVRILGGGGINPFIPPRVYAPANLYFGVKRLPQLHPAIGKGLSVVPGRITAFVGRLDTDTSEEQLKDFLLEAGLVQPLP